jgi:hypothetical protein
MAILATWFVVQHWFNAADCGDRISTGGGDVTCSGRSSVWSIKLDSILYVRKCSGEGHVSSPMP